MRSPSPQSPRFTSGQLRGFSRVLLVKGVLLVITLVLLSLLVFFGGQYLPGDIGRAILGPLSDPQAVATLNHQLGVDRPLLEQYSSWIVAFAQGDMGTSYMLRSPVAPLVLGALFNSLKLGGLAFVIVVPLGIVGGVVGALHHGGWIDRVITICGVSATVVPEFVSALGLILVFGVWLQWLPIDSVVPEGASWGEHLRHMVLPVLPLVLGYFGYIARMARAGMIEALDADYTRTATLKGLPRRTVVMRHVLRNALLPTLTVSATQLGYMIGGLVVVETLFHYQGIGSVIYNAAKSKDFPVLEAAVLLIGVVYTISNLSADILNVLLNPRLRSRGAA